MHTTDHFVKELDEVGKWRILCLLSE